MSIFAFRPEPQGDGMTADNLLTSGLDAPLSLASTLWNETKEGALGSFGLGTVLREASLPQEAPIAPPAPMVRGMLGMAPQPGAAEDLAARREQAGAITEDQYKASPSFRTNVPWDQGMTEDRAKALADMSDLQKVREFYGAKRPITAFLGKLGGGALDPINYIPIAGEAVVGANVARFGFVAGRAITASADAMVNTAIASMVTAPARSQIGDDVLWQSTISQVAMSGLIGAAFGTVIGSFGARRAVQIADAAERLATLKRTQEARVAVNDAMDGLVRNGKVELSPASQGFIEDVPVHQLPDTMERLSELQLGDIRKESLARFDESQATLADLEKQREALAAPQQEIAARETAAQSLNAEVTSLRTDFESAQQRHAAIEPALNEATQARLDAIDADLQRPALTTEQRTTLEAEKSTILESVSAAQEPEQARLRASLKQEVQGLEKALQTKQKSLDKMQAKQARQVKSLSQKTNRIDVSVAREQARLRSRQSDATAYLGRSIADLAQQGYRVRLSRAEAEQMATPILSERDDVSAPVKLRAVTDALKKRSIAEHGSVKVGAVAEERASANAYSPAEPPPEPNQIAAAAQVGKPDNIRAIAEQYRVNPETGEFPEQDQLQQLIAEGRLSEEDAANIKIADENFATATAFGDALKAAMTCVAP